MAAQDRIPIIDNDAHLQPSASAFPEEHLFLVKLRKQAGTDNETECDFQGMRLKVVNCTQTPAKHR